MAFGGGMDSTGLLVHLLSQGYTVNCLSYNYGQKHSVELDDPRQISNVASKGFMVSHRIVT